MTTLPTAITGEHLKAWDFECSGHPLRTNGKLVTPHIVFYMQDPYEIWRFLFSCPRCQRVHTPSLVAVLDHMYLRWERETRSFREVTAKTVRRRPAKFSTLSTPKARVA